MRGRGIFQRPGCPIGSSGDGTHQRRENPAVFGILNVVQLARTHLKRLPSSPLAVAKTLTLRNLYNQLTRMPALFGIDFVEKPTLPRGRQRNPIGRINLLLKLGELDLPIPLPNLGHGISRGSGRFLPGVCVRRKTVPCVPILFLTTRPVHKRRNVARLGSPCQVAFLFNCKNRRPHMLACRLSLIATRTRA